MSTPRALAIAGILHGGTRLQAERRIIVKRPEAGDQYTRQRNDRQPIDGKRILPERDRTAGYRDRRQERTKDQSARLGPKIRLIPQVTTSAPSSRPVERRDDRPLSNGAEQTTTKKSEEWRTARTAPPMPRKAGSVSAHHHQFAMGKIDNVHHAEDDNQAQGGKQKERAIGGELVEDADNRREAVHARYSNLLDLMRSGPGVA